MKNSPKQPEHSFSLCCSGTFGKPQIDPKLYIKANKWGECRVAGNSIGPGDTLFAYL
jgi:hypothetical protein